MLILHVGPKDMGEYTVIAENALGRAECSTILSVRGEREIPLCFNAKDRKNKSNVPNDAKSCHLSSIQSEDAEATAIKAVFI